MGFDNECIQNIQSLKGEYFCPVCRLLVYPNEALQSQCSHLYCKPCLKYIVGTTQACPYDGYLVTEADSKPLLQSNKVLADTIGKIAVYCLFHRSGCTWQGQLADCTTHCSGCPFGDSSVMCNRCSVKIVHRQVEEHAQKCPAVQVQAPQPDNGQVASSNQNQTAPPASASASQVQIASAASGVVQQSAQQVNPVAPAQSAQPAIPNTEQWYQQQQQQYQQYYQQYAGYDPYQQQQYQQSYPYQQPVPGQQQPYLQTQFQQAPASHTSQQPQQLPQAPPAAQPQPRPPQATPIIQQQIQPAGQPQTLQNHVAYSMPQSQAQTYSQVQPYAHPQTGTNVVPQQGMQMTQYPQTRPQIQPQQGMQMPQYPHSQAQHYSHPQTHLPPQSQIYPHPNSHTTTLPPPQGSQPTQPMNHAAPLQAPNASAQAVTGYQSYQQAQVQPLQQTQAGAPHTLHMNGLQQQPTNSSQLQTQFPQQPTQVRPPFVPAMIPNQQPTTVPSQVLNTGASVAQVPTYPHPKHPGYPLQHHSSMQPVQHASAHPQGFPGHGPYAQQHPVIRAPAVVQASGQGYQQSSTPAPMQPNARPMISHGGGPQAYSQAPGLTNAAHLPIQSSMNQSYPSLPVQNMEKSKQEHTNVELGSGNLASVGTTESKPLVGSDAKSHVSENGTPQKGNVKIKEETVDKALELPSADVGNGDFKENDQHSGKGFSISALPPVSSVSTKQFAKEAPDSRSVPSSDHGRNQMPLVPGAPSLPQSYSEPGASQFLGQPPGQLRPQVPGKMHPSHSIYSDNSSGGVIGSSGVVPYGRGPGSVGLPQAHFNQSKFPAGPPFVSPPSGSRGGISGGVRPDFPEGNVSKPNFPEGNVSKPHPPNHIEGPGGFSDGRPPELRPHGLMDQRPFGQASSFHRLQDERMNMLPGEHLKPFPTDHSFGHRDFEGELKKFPRPSHLEGGAPVNFGPRFPPPAPLDQSPHILGDRPRLAGFRDASLGRLEYPDYPRHGPGFVHHESRFPGLSGHLQSGEFDAPVNIHGTDRLIADSRQHSRAGDGNGQTMLPIHSRRGDFGSRNAHSREAAGPGSFQGHLEMGEPPFPGSYLPPRPFAEPYGREMPGYPHIGEPGFRSNFRQYAHDDRFYRGEMEPFDNPRRRRPGGMMCRICNVDCETVEGLDMHAQTREHQKKSMDMVISIKQQSSKKQKVSNQRSLFEEGRKNRTASFEGHGKKH